MIRCANLKRVFFALYLIVGIYVTVMYLMCSFRGEQRSYSMMMNLSLAFGIFSGVFFVETDKSRWVVPLFLGVLWGAGVAIRGVSGEIYVYRDLSFLLLFYVPFLAVWVLSRMKKGRNLIFAFVGALFSLFSLGLLPGRGKLEPLYDILLVVMPAMTFMIVAQCQSQRQRWVSLLVFLAVYSYVIMANPYINMVMFAVVATVLVMVVAVLSAAWKDKIKNIVLAIMVCLMSALAVIAIPSWTSFATTRFCYPEYALPLGKQVEFESAFVTPENDTISLETHLDKTVVLYFWTASCGACHAMMPEFSALAKSYENTHDVIFYAVLLRENESEERKRFEEVMLEEYGFQWIMPLDAKEVMRKLGFNEVPHLTIVSADGIVTYNGSADFRRTNICNPRRCLNRR